MTPEITPAQLHVIIIAIQYLWLDAARIVLRCWGDVAVVVRLLVLVVRLVSMATTTWCSRINGALMAGWGRAESVPRHLVELAMVVMVATA